MESQKRKISINEGGEVSNDECSEIHSVALPGGKSTLHKLKDKLLEVFFPDDPLHQFKKKCIKTKFILGVQFFFPICEWLPKYQLNDFKFDLIAGLTMASLAIPQGISYAKLAELPPIIGLYSSFVPPIIYSILGSSKHLGVSTVSIASLVMGGMLSEVVSPATQPQLFLKLAFTSTLFAGLFQASLGFFRLGFIIDFLSKATLIGFTAGAAIIVSLQQLKDLLGIIHFTNKMQIVSVIKSVFSHKNEWSWQAIIMGISFLVFMLSARQISLKKPKLFWISAAAPLTSVIISTLLVFCLRSNQLTIPIVGKLPKGLNPPSINQLYFDSHYIALAAKTGLMTGILSLTEGIAVGRTFASMENYQVDGNKEMMAIGMMNIVGSLTSCYVSTAPLGTLSVRPVLGVLLSGHFGLGVYGIMGGVTASRIMVIAGGFSRSAVNYNAGAKSAFSNVVMSVTVLITLLFLMPLFYYTPNVVLGAIIITAVIGLVDYEAAYQLWKVDKLDFIACLCAFLGVLFISVPVGLSIAVGISVFKVLLHISRPNIVIMGNISGTQIYQSIERYKTASRIPSFLIIGIESPIYFANSTYLQERILRSIREEEERIESSKYPALKCVVLDLTAVTAIDTSGIVTVCELGKITKNKSLQLALVNPVASVVEKLHKSKALDQFSSNKGLYMTIAEAVLDITTSWKA